MTHKSKIKKSFFYVPTWILVLFFIIFTCSCFIEVFFFTNINEFKTIYINGVSYTYETEQFKSGIKMIKFVLIISLFISISISSLSGVFTVKRILGRKSGNVN